MPGFGGFLGGAGSGAAAGASFGLPGIIGGGLLGGLFGLFGGNDNSNDFAYGLAQDYQSQANQFLDPNNPFYRNAARSYYKDLNKTLNASSPGTAGLLALSKSAGNSYGSSQSIATQKMNAILSRNRDAASQSSDRFQGQLFQQGLGAFTSLQNNAANLYNLYGGGARQQQNLNAGFNNQLLGLGGGLLSRYFNQNNQSGGSEGFGDQGGYNPFTQGFPFLG